MSADYRVAIIVFVVALAILFVGGLVGVLSMLTGNDKVVYIAFRAIGTSIGVAVVAFCIAAGSYVYWLSNLSDDERAVYYAEEEERIRNTPDSNYIPIPMYFPYLR